VLVGLGGIEVVEYAFSATTPGRPSMGTVTRLRATTPKTLTDLVGEFFDHKDLSRSTMRVYTTTFDALIEDLGQYPIDTIDTGLITVHLNARYGLAAAATYNRSRSAISSLFAFAERRGWIDHNPAHAVERHRERPDAAQLERRRAIPIRDLEALWGRKDIPIRERTLWRLAFDTAGRANEILGLDVENLNLGERSARVTGKGGAAEIVHWATGTARLLPRLLDGRTTGPVFLSDRLPLRPMAITDIDPITGRARLSYRRAATLFSDYSDGWTLHQLRHSSLTHLAEQGVDLALLKAKSRHRSLRSLERYVRPSDAAVAKLTAHHDIDARR
jgi:integrase